MPEMTNKDSAKSAETAEKDGYAKEGDQASAEAAAPAESGGREGPDPTRYGDWEKDGRCIDF